MPDAKEDLIEKYAWDIAREIQAACGMSETATYDLKLLLAEFAEEIKRQAIEP